MADGGASSIIFLATALLVSGSVSAILVSQWGEMASTFDEQRRGDEADAKTSFSFAGDLSNVEYDTNNPVEIITIYLQNTGTYSLDEESLFIQMDGSVIADVDVSVSILPSGAVWGAEQLLEVELSGSWSLPDNSDVSLTVLVISDAVGGFTGNAVESVEVRLNEV